MSSKSATALISVIILTLILAVTYVSCRKGRLQRESNRPVRRTFQHFSVNVPAFWACHSEEQQALTGALLEVVTIHPSQFSMPLNFSVFQLAKPNMRASEVAALGQTAFKIFRSETFNPQASGLPTPQGKTQLFKGLESSRAVSNFDLFGKGAAKSYGFSVIKNDKLLSVSYQDKNEGFEKMLPVIEEVVSSIEVN